MNYFSFFVDAVLPYISFPLFGLGLLWRLRDWARTPLPLNVGLPPFPRTNPGRVRRIASEVILFRTFLQSDRPFWFIIWPFHVAGLLTLGNHLLGITDGMLEVYAPGSSPPQVKTILFVAAFAAWLLVGFLLTIGLRRFLNHEIRRMSFASDYFPVFLLLGLVSSGAYMSFFAPVDMRAVSAWGQGLFTFRPVPVGSPAFSVHFLFGQTLFMYFPFGKLFHPLGQIASRMMTRREDPLNPEGKVLR
ncbi:MAG: respiratory nitrate reductase subunit gamma [Chloroflexi bacterium]|nr:respiratory nitrate reductase subunit gamma [Chloroflexota bacterium]